MKRLDDKKTTNQKGVRKASVGKIHAFPVKNPVMFRFILIFSEK
jgi:hypothetical protein